MHQPAGIGIPPAPSPLLTDDARSAWEWLARYNEFVGQQAAREADPGCEQCAVNRQLLEEVWQAVARLYYDPTEAFAQAAWAHQLLATLQEAGGVLPDTEQAYKAASAMVESLHDRWSRFLPPPAFRAALRAPSPAEREQLAASSSGTGLVLGEAAAGGWRVEAVLAGSPAEAAGVQQGDLLRSIDGQPVLGLQRGQVEGRLRGLEGASVHVSLASASAGNAARDIILPLRDLQQPPVVQADLRTANGGLVRYLRLPYFAAGATPRAVQAAVEAGEAAGAGAYILDLRNNPGGSFDAAVEVACLLLPEGAPLATTVTVRFGGGADGEWVAGALDPVAFPRPLPGQLTGRPVVLLVNRGTASAAEMLAGALQDNGRALVVGEAATYGKGLLQDYFAAADGSGLQLTVAKFITPGGWDATEKGGLPPSRGLLCSDHPRGRVPVARSGSGGSGGSSIGDLSTEADALLDDCITLALQQLAKPR